MATEVGRARSALIRRLFEQPYRFEFFQAVRLLEQWSREASGSSGAVGEDADPRREVVRFKALPSLSFPAGDVARLESPSSREDDVETEPRPAEMTVAFMGLTGPAGVLPRHYTSMLIERAHARHKDTALRDFFDLFHHRTVSLYYRAWEKYRFPFAYERRRRQGRSDHDLFTFCLLSLVGLGTAGEEDRLGFPSEALVYYSGHFAHAPRCAVALELMIADHFGIQAEVVQFVGQWLYLSEEDQSSMPSPTHPEGRNLQLGVNTVAGTRVWDVEGRFRVRLGPVDSRRFLDLMPSGSSLEPLGSLVRYYAGPQFDFDVQVVLSPESVPWCRLGASGDEAPRLGWNTWVRSSEFQKPVDDPVFRLPSL